MKKSLWMKKKADSKMRIAGASYSMLEGGWGMLKMLDVLALLGGCWGTILKAALNKPSSDHLRKDDT